MGVGGDKLAFAPGFRTGFCAALILTSVLGSAPVAAHAAEAAPGAFDHGPWSALLSRHVHDGHVDYEGILADRESLDLYLESLAEADIRDWSDQEKMAFWINAYNAFMIDAVIAAWPVDSVLDIDRLLGLIPTGGVFRTPRRIARAERSLDDLEHKILRPRYKDPRIHAAINCASVSCPKLWGEAFVPDRLDEQLDAAMSAFVNDPARNRVELDPPQLSSIFKWFAGDFEMESGSVWAYVRAWLPEERRRIVPVETRPGFLSYDWSLNR